MKTKIFLVLAIFFVMMVSTVSAGTVVDVFNPYAWIEDDGNKSIRYDAVRIDLLSTSAEVNWRLFREGLPVCSGWFSYDEGLEFDTRYQKHDDSIPESNLSGVNFALEVKEPEGETVYHLYYWPDGDYRYNDSKIYFSADVKGLSYLSSGNFTTELGNVPENYKVIYVTRSPAQSTNVSVFSGEDWKINTFGVLREGTFRYIIIEDEVGNVVSAKSVYLLHDPFDTCPWELKVYNICPESPGLKTYLEL